MRPQSAAYRGGYATEYSTMDGSAHKVHRVHHCTPKARRKHSQSSGSLKLKNADFANSADKEAFELRHSERIGRRIKLKQAHEKFGVRHHRDVTEAESAWMRKSR